MALPFMLAQMGLPADLFQLYSVSGVINGRFATLLACMELICITLITTGFLLGRVRPKLLVPRMAAAIGVAVVMIIGMRLMLEQTVPVASAEKDRLANMTIEDRPYMLVETDPNKIPEPRSGLKPKVGTDGKRILRVGYLPDRFPFAYMNAQEKLVGHDIELMARMAEDLDFLIQWYPTSLALMSSHLNEGRLDFVVSGITLSTSRINKVGFSEPYAELVLGAVASEENKARLASLSPDELATAELMVAVATPNPYLDAFETALPKATFTYIQSPKGFYEAEYSAYDALLISMEAGSAWNMLYPGYSTVILKEGAMKKELVVAARPDNADLVRYLNDWLRLQQSKGLMDALYEYWIMGHPRPSDEEIPRWCIARDVLGWGRK